MTCITMIDARGVQTAECPLCGGNILRLDVIFDEDGTITFYMDWARCAQCGSFVTPPMPEEGNLIYPVGKEQKCQESSQTQSSKRGSIPLIKHIYSTRTKVSQIRSIKAVSTLQEIGIK